MMAFPVHEVIFQVRQLVGMRGLMSDPKVKLLTFLFEVISVKVLL
jgi:hypothetical protein